jgi:hypothetical protein
LFDYDIFISFALGPLPRGTHSYASDLARRLRDLDFTVFFSEDEAPVGNQLDSTLRKALLRSHALVVIANRAMLDDPRWVRIEVGEFRKARPSQPIVPINVGGALQDDELSARVSEWLPHKGNIWVDDSTEAVSGGLASDGTINRLARAPRFRKANRRWRVTVGMVMVSLVALAVWLYVLNDNLRTAIHQQTALRLNEEAQAIMSDTRPGGPVLGLSKLLAAHRIAPHSEIEGTMLAQVVAFKRLKKIIETGAPVKAVAFSSNGTRLVSGSGDGTLRLWDAPKVWPDLLCAKLTYNMSRKEWREQVSPDIEYLEQCTGLPILPDTPAETLPPPYPVP